MVRKRATISRRCEDMETANMQLVPRRKQNSHGLPKRGKRVTSKPICNFTREGQKVAARRRHENIEKIHLLMNPDFKMRSFLEMRHTKLPDIVKQNERQVREICTNKLHPIQFARNNYIRVSILRWVAILSNRDSRTRQTKWCENEQQSRAGLRIWRQRICSLSQEENKIHTAF